MYSIFDVDNMKAVGKFGGLILVANKLISDCTGRLFLKQRFFLFYLAWASFNSRA